jgi:hypothetical protein
MLRAQFRHGVIADARKPRASRTGRDVLDRRVRQRDDLPIVAEGIHLAESLAEIEQLGDGAQPLAQIFGLRRHLGHFLKELLGVDVAIDVD